MVQTLQRNQVEKMYFDIVFNLSLHHVREFEPCQTRFNIFTLFLSPSWRLGPKISLLLSMLLYDHGRIGIRGLVDFLG